MEGTMCVLKPWQTCFFVGSMAHTIEGQRKSTPRFFVKCRRKDIVQTICSDFRRDGARTVQQQTERVTGPEQGTEKCSCNSGYRKMYALEDNGRLEGGEDWQGRGQKKRDQMSWASRLGYTGKINTHPPPLPGPFSLVQPTTKHSAITFPYSPRCLFLSLSLSLSLSLLLFSFFLSSPRLFFPSCQFSAAKLLVPQLG